VLGGAAPGFRCVKARNERERGGRSCLNGLLVRFPWSTSGYLIWIAAKPSGKRQLSCQYAGSGLQGHMIEIAGYSLSTGTKELNQQLSEDRAANVVQYPQETQNRRRTFRCGELVPAGYGATHPDENNTDSQGRALNRRVGVKVLVNKGLTKEFDRTP